MSAPAPSFSRSRRSSCSGMRKPHLSLRWLLAVVVMMVVGSFASASYALKVSLDERNQRIVENTAATVMNARRTQRNCERIGEIVRLVDGLVPGVQLTLKLQEIDNRYPDVTPCRLRP